MRVKLRRSLSIPLAAVKKTPLPSYRRHSTPPKLNLLVCFKRHQNVKCCMIICFPTGPVIWIPTRRDQYFNVYHEICVSWSMNNQEILSLLIATWCHIKKCTVMLNGTAQMQHPTFITHFQQHGIPIQQHATFHHAKCSLLYVFGLSPWKNRDRLTLALASVRP